MKRLLILLMVLVILPSVYAANAFWVNDPVNCPLQNQTEFSGQNCDPENICGDSSGIAQCFDTSTLSAPSSNSTSNTNVDDGSFDGGFLLNCFADADSASPFCDNSGNFNCDRNSTVYSTLFRQTICLENQFGVTVQGSCRSGYNDCDADGGVCEILTGASCSLSTGTYNVCNGLLGNCTSSTNSDCNDDDGDSNLLTCNGANGCEVIGGGSCGNSTGTYANSECLGSVGNCTSAGTNLDCNDDDSDLNELTCNGVSDGCEIVNNSACSVGVLSGTYQGCSAFAGNCVVSKSYFETGTETAYSTSDALLWGTQYGGGPLINFTNANTNETFLVNGSGCIIFPDNTTQCTGTLSTNFSTVALLNATNIFTANQTFSENITVVNYGFFGWLGSITNFITGLFVTDINLNGTLSGNGSINITGDIETSGNVIVGGNMTVDTDILFVDSDNDKVGIGTTNPTQKLDVNGSVNVSGVYYGDGSGLTNIGGVSLLVDSINTTHIKDGTILTEDIADNNITSSKIANGTITDTDISDTTNLTLGQRLIFALGGFIQNIISGQVDVNGTLNVTGGLNVDSGTLFVNETNDRVGIGTTSPTHKLDVNGSIKTSETYEFYDGSTQGLASTPDGFGWQVTTASFKQNFSVVAQEIDSQDVFFKPDGTKMYMIGLQDDDVNEYNLTTPWDVSTTSFVQNFSVPENAGPRGLFFKSDGTKMYIPGSSGSEINEYNLSSPWNVSSISFNQVITVSAQGEGPQDVFFKPDGTKMYVVGGTTDNVSEYDLSTAWDVSTVDFVQSFDVNSEVTFATGLFFKPDGTKMYVIGTSNEVNEYNLFTPWDISSASFNHLLGVSTQETGSTGLFFKPDGTKMYVVGTDGDEVNEYDLGLIIEGNVGIGTTSPTQKLDVNGNVNIADNLTLGQRITFALGGFIQNIISGQVDINGTLNVTNDSLVGGDLNVSGDTNIDGNINANATYSTNNHPSYDPLGDQLVLYLPFSEGSGAGTTYDRSRFGNDGTLTNISGWTTGKLGNGLELDGNDDIVSIPSSSSIALTANFTWTYWVKFDLVTGIRTAMIWSSTGYFSDINNGKFAFGRTGVTHDVTSSQSAIVDRWYHVAVTVNESGGVVQYIDGKQDVSGSTTLITPTGNLQISHNSFPVDGMIDEIKIYGRVLTSDEVLSEYLRGVNVSVRPYTDDQTGDVNFTGVIYGDGSGLTGIGADSLLAGSINTTHILDGTITDADINDSTNLTLGQKIVFALGGFIQNIISGRIDVNGTLNVAGGLNVSENVNIEGNLTVTNNIDITNGSLFQPVYGSDDGLVLYLPFSEPNGSTQFDRSPYGYDGTQTGTVTCNSSNGKYGSGCSFTGGTNYVEVTSSTSNIEFSDDFTIEAWVKTTTVGGGIVAKNDGDSSFELNEKQFYVADGSSGTVVGAITLVGHSNSLIKGTSPVNDGVWHYVAVTWDSTGSTGKIYVDGIDDTLSDAYSSSADAGNVVRIGWSLATGSPIYFNGSLDEVKIYSRTLDEDEIRTHYLRGSGSGTSGAITADKFRVVNTTGTNVMEVNSTGLHINEGNITLQQKITFALGGFIQNIISGRIDINGTLNVTENLTVGGDITVNNINAENSITASNTYLFSDASTQPYAATPSDFGWDVNTAVLNQNISIQEPVPTGVFFKPDGSKMYIVGTTDYITEYNLSISWNISTAIFHQNLSVTSEEGNPLGLFFRQDGRKMYIIGHFGVEVNEYNLSSAWDISTAVPNQNFNVSTFDTVPNGVSFKPDGRKMYIVGYANDLIHEFDLSTSWDISTAVITQNFNIAAQEGLSTDLFFNPSGYKMYIIGASSDAIQEYDLGVPWDISSASFVGNFSLPVGSPEGLFFNPSGSKMYFVGTPGVFEYDLGLSVTGTLLVEGNVGIGTTTPTEKLHLANGTFLQTIGDPTLVGSLIDSTNMNNSFAVYVSGKYAYVTGSDSDSIAIVDISDPSSPTLTGSLIDSANMNAVNDVYVSGKYAYVVGYDSDSLAIVDISDPSSPTLTGSLIDGTNMNGATDVYVSGKYAYISASLSHSLAIVDISDPSLPTLTGSLNDSTNMNRPSDLYVRGKYAYVVGEVGDSLAIVDISDPSLPTLTGSLNDSTNMDAPRGVFVSGKYAYVGGFGSASLAIVDISNASSPTLTGSLIDSSKIGGANDIYVSGKYAYVAGTSFAIVDISNPSSPTLAGSLIDSTNLNAIYGIHVSGKYAYVASRGSDSLSIIDISGIDAPSASIGNIEAGYLSVTDNAVIANDLYSAGLNVGPHGIKSDGDVSFSDNTLVTSSGFVGIGTTNPTQKLHIEGSGSTRFLLNSTSGLVNLMLSGQGTGGDGFLSFLNDGNLQWSIQNDASTSQKLKFKDSSSNTVMALTQDGYVGIGTSSPSSRLHVIDSLTNSNSIARFAKSDSITSVGATSVNDSYYLQLGGQEFGIGSQRLIGFGYKDTQNFVPAHIGFIETSTSIATKGELIFATRDVTTDTEPIERVRITDGGNVGIGTSIPAVPLHVNSSGNATVLRLQDTDGTCNQNPEAGSLTISCSSDKKLKENIKEAESVLEEFEDIEVKDYVVKASGKEMTGVIAQEINKTHPELVHVEDGELFVEQPNPWKLLKAIQELREMFESLIGGNYTVGFTGIIVDEDTVGTATVLVNETSVQINFTDEYEVVPIVTVTPREFIEGQYRVSEETTTGFIIELQEVQEIDIGLNWHAFAQAAVEVVNESNVTGGNITNGTTSNVTIEINGTLIDDKNNETIEIINETLNNTNETINNETINETLTNETISNETVELNKTTEENNDTGSSPTGEEDNGSFTEVVSEVVVENVHVQEDLPEEFVLSLITGGAIGVNEEEASEEGIFSRFFGMIFGSVEGGR